MFSQDRTFFHRERVGASLNKLAAYLALLLAVLLIAPVLSQAEDIDMDGREG